MKKLLSITLFFVSCNSGQRPLQINKTNVACLLAPAFMERSHIKVYSTPNPTAEILVDTYPSYEKPPDTFYYKKVRLSHNLVHQLDTAVFRPVFSSKSQLSPGTRDGISMSFLETNGASLDTVTYSNPASGTVGYKLSVKAINFYRSVFQDSILSSYFDEVLEYYSASDANIGASHKMTPIKRRREAMYPQFRYRR